MHKEKLFPKMTAIATYVFCDIETTGLPRLENNRTKITEISFVAIKSKHFLQTKRGCEPRMQQKLTLCLNPGRMIQPESTEITGMCNTLLEDEPCFDLEVFTVIKEFLQLLTKPICLITHNGHTFDFPILKYQLQKLGVRLAGDILCVDSLYGFYDILEERSGNPKSEKVYCAKEKSKRNNKRPSEESNSSSADDQDAEEITDNAHKRLKVTHEERITVLPLSKARRPIFFVKGNGKNPDKSYKLIDIYRRLFDVEPVDSHCAEGDCLLALKCALRLRETFVQWVNDNVCWFSEVKPMTQGRRLGF